MIISIKKSVDEVIDLGLLILSECVERALVSQLHPCLKGQFRVARMLRQAVKVLSVGYFDKPDVLQSLHQGISGMTGCGSLLRERDRQSISFGDHAKSPATCHEQLLVDFLALGEHPPELDFARGSRRGFAPHHSLGRRVLPRGSGAQSDALPVAPPKQPARQPSCTDAAEQAELMAHEMLDGFPPRKSSGVADANKETGHPASQMPSKPFINLTTKITCSHFKKLLVE